MGRRPVSAAPSRAVCALSCLWVLGCARPEPDGTAPSAEPPPLLGVPDTRVHPPGELGRARDYTMSVETVKDCPMPGPFAPARGHDKVGVEVVVQGSTGNEVPVNPFYATLTDASATYRSTLAGCEPALPSVRVIRDQTARGFVTFEVPSGARKLELRYAPTVIGPGLEELRFLVER